MLRREKVENRRKIKEILYQVLDVYDGFQKLFQIAVEQDWPDAAKEFLQTRFGLSGKRLIQVLARAGAMQINSLGQPFNHEYHEIIKEVYNPDVPEGNIVDVVQEGYIFEGETLRTAKVITATSKRPE